MLNLRERAVINTDSSVSTDPDPDPHSDTDADVAFRDADPKVLAFLGAWKSARGDRLVPFRHDFDPLAVPSLLRCAWIYRFDKARGDYVCELAGEEINDTWGRSIKSLTLFEIVGPRDHAVVTARWKKVLEGPLVQFGWFSDSNPVTLNFEAQRLVLPLASRSGELDTVLGFSLYRISLPDTDRPPPFVKTVKRVPCSAL